MAGDWIPRCKGLNRKPEVLMIARLTGRDRRIVTDILMEFWEWCDTESADGNLPGISLAQLTDTVPGTDEAFWLAVVQAGWLVVREDGLELPNFDRWLGRSAKRRVEDSKRKRIERGGASEGERPSIPLTLRRHVLKRDDQQCVYCGWRPPAKAFPWTNQKADLLSVDHVVPVVQGGATAAENLVTACLRCNAQKWGCTPEEAGLEMRFLTEAARAELVRRPSDRIRTTEQNSTDNKTPPYPPEGGTEGEGENFKRPTQTEFVQRWNEVAGFRKCLRLTGRRLRWFQSRVRDRFWCEHWLEALERASRLPFCLGQNDRSWRADVDWFLRELTVLRLIEGGYLENAGTRPARPAELPEQRAARLAAEREARERAAREALPSVQAKELLSKVLRKKMVSSEGVQKP